jgi:hypothetical protein
MSGEVKPTWASVGHHPAAPGTDKASLQILERHFHTLIHQRIDEGNLSHDLDMPRLTSPARLFRKAGFFPVPGMCGGFQYRLVGTPDCPVLEVSSWCRVVEGSEMDHRITVDGTVLVSQG